MLPHGGNCLVGYGRRGWIGLDRKSRSGPKESRSWPRGAGAESERYMRVLLRRWRHELQRERVQRRYSGHCGCDHQSRRCILKMKPCLLEGTDG